MANFKELFQNQAYGMAVKNTIFIVGMAMPFLCGLVIEKNLKRYKSLQGWLLVPMALPAASMVLVWENVFETKGLLSAVTGSKIDWLSSSWAPFIVIGLII